jgi:IgGFc binding protein
VKVDVGKPPVVAYVQQFAAARSAATLLLPVNVLGKKYYAISAAQDGTGGGRSQFQVIAIKDNTVIEITPVKDGIKKPTFTVSLPLAGDMIQYQSNDPNSASQDLTGTLIESVASGCIFRQFKYKNRKQGSQLLI